MAAICAACTASLKAGRLPMDCQACSHTLSSSAPEGWEKTVEHMKEHSEIENPFALAHWMNNQGYEPHAEAGTVRAAWTKFRTAQERPQALKAGGLALDPDVTQKKLAPIVTDKAPEGEEADEADGDEEGTHSEPDGDEINVPGVGLIEPHDIPEPVHASALTQALVSAINAAADVPVMQTPGIRRALRYVAPVQPVQRYVIHAEAYAMPRITAVDGHPNRVPFKAVLHTVDAASDRPPNGANGHNVLIPRSVAARRLHTLIGMGINVQGNARLSGHNVKQKIGVITHASIDEDPDPSVYVPGFRPLKNTVMVAGWLYAKDFPNEVNAIITASRAGILGTSYEVGDVALANVNAEPWVVTDMTYTGAAALRRTTAAYQSTQLAASAHQR